MQRDAAALKAALADLEQRNLKRTRRVMPRHDLVDFCSNDYLGLKNHLDVVRAFTAAAEKYGVGSGASHLVTGHGIEHEALEAELAAFTGRERALVFSTGYMANLGVIGALADQKSLIVADKLNHASLIDGCRLAGGTVKRFRHGDAAHAREQFGAGEPGSTRLLVTDGVFSMDGDVAPLPELVRLANGANAWLIVDDAHAFGVVGATGRGTTEHFRLSAHDVPVVIGTFGKAFGTFGAFVAGDADLIEYLVQKARPYIYTTALPPAVAAATRAALALSDRESWRREKVLAHARRFRTAMIERGFAKMLPITDVITPIQPLILGEEERALSVSRALEAKGLLIAAIRPPTVPAGTARLRITFSAAHEESHISRLIDAVSAILSP
ncbi:MAG TPA: 8-amino-7-oxononanoate synthase [Steroidobacteraceae bacterium]|nr:8-amino-7-oxononanoate synthase [Steroidobacteraceae bacterium]